MASKMKVASIIETTFSQMTYILSLDYQKRFDISKIFSNDKAQHETNIKKAYPILKIKQEFSQIQPSNERNLSAN